MTLIKVVIAKTKRLNLEGVDRLISVLPTALTLALARGSITLAHLILWAYR